jgi:hypothetical protein
MNNNGKNRKLLWAAGAVLVFLYFAPAALQSFRQEAYYRQQEEAARTRAQAARGAAQAAPPAAASPSPTPLSNLTGMWQGEQAQSNRDLCRMALEMRDNGAGGLTAYPRISCVALMPYLPGPHKLTAAQAAAKSMSPVSAVLTGNLKDGAVAFRVDKTIGATFDGCTMTAFSVTPFGNDEVAAEWQNGTCGKGQMVLRRVGR